MFPVRNLWLDESEDLFHVKKLWLGESDDVSCKKFVAG